MSQRIAILPEILTNKIAAGEVVERPASVIKELVENALDAGATDICVEISAGGRRLIRITDNGHGMSREDALLSLERHATSKIKSDSDLEHIMTLGFRGEALPSIASVSRFRLATRESGTPEGTEIYVEGGKVKDVKACGMAPGTVLTVEHLFFNTPARLKFMKSAETESGHIGDVVARMAVSRPDVSFTCINDGRELLKVQRSDLQRRLSQVIGKDTASGLYQVEHATEEATISGFVSGPTLARSGMHSMYTYINGRFVRDKVVQHAILQAYRGVIDRGRYPVMALFIALPPGEIDVNVHPTKHEVRFRHQSAMHDAIQGAVEQVLSRSPWLAGKSASAQPSAPPTGQAYRERIAAAAQASLDMTAKPTYTATQPPTLRTASVNESLVSAPQAIREDPGAVKESAESFQSGSDPCKRGYFSSLTVIGQFHGEYILCQSGVELVVIDQHAASERVAYQKLKQQHLSGGVESQRLLFPETVELTFGEVAVSEKFRSELNNIGFELEPFGGNTLMISAVPRLAAEKDAVRLVRDLLADLAAIGASAAFQERMDDMFSRIACHSVVRGVHPLEMRQMSELLRSMDETDFAASCPHGRPVSHVITLAELEKIFKRT